MEIGGTRQRRKKRTRMRRPLRRARDVFKKFMFSIKSMVAIAIYYFAPFRVIKNQLQCNNSKNICNLLFQNNSEDVTFFELPVVYEAINPLLVNAPKFDFVVAIGEDETLKGHARYEKISRVDGITVRNPLRVKYLYANTKYDPQNDFVCNFVNYHMISNLQNCLFIHVPVSTAKNNDIAKTIRNEIVHQRQKMTHHTIMSEKLPRSQHEIGFEKVCKVHPRIGKLFTAKKRKRHVMTMKNTYIPLDILFLSKPIEGIQTIEKIEIGIPRAQKDVVGVSFDVLEMPFPYCIVNNVRPGHTIHTVFV